MVAKKKTKKRQTRSRGTAGKKTMPTKKLAKKSAIVAKKSAKKKPGQKEAAVKTKLVGKKTTRSKTAGALAERRSQSPNMEPFSRPGLRSRSAGQSGDLQGLSNVETVDSESVDELIEEGNAFEADVVTGVEDAGNADEKEVHTHEVPEDDVPGEYLEKE